MSINIHSVCITSKLCYQIEEVKAIGKKFVITYNQLVDAMPGNAGKKKSALYKTKMSR